MVRKKIVDYILNSNHFVTNNYLSERELGVLKLLVKGYDYKIIAEKLFLSSHTVRKHIANIYAKLHVTSKAQAINLVHKKRWFEV